jgi:hypothetical protein
MKKTKTLSDILESWQQVDIPALNNKNRIKLYSELELCKLEVSQEDGISSSQSNEEIEQYTSQLSLLYQNNGLIGWWHNVDEIIRLLCVCITLILFSVVMVIPCTMLLFIDYCVVDKLGLLPSCFKINLLVKRAIGNLLLLMAGIVLVVEYPNFNDSDRNNCANTPSFWHRWYRNSQRFLGESIDGERSASGLVCFTHASSLDAFILSAVVPIPSYTYVSLI